MISFTPQMQEFIQTHINDDTSSLLFAAHRYEGIDVPWAVEQIEARKRLKAKLPEWYANPRLIMSGRVPAEQCSSEQTARYKATMVEGCTSLCDMTGGMGVDFYYMSEGMSQAIYTERSEMLCEAMRHNLIELNRVGEVRNGDGRELPIPDVDVIYLDPARRATDGSRVYAIEDCEPNVVEWQDKLLQHCKKLIVKLSPMVDITDLLRKLKNVQEVHIVAVRNECKEVLAVQVPQAEETYESDVCKIYCVDFLASETLSVCIEKRAIKHFNYADDINYLYDPEVTLMKAQAFSWLCENYGVQPLDRETHLFASEGRVGDFPGRTFIVEDIIPFSSKALKSLKKRVAQANIAVRNFPLTADELRRRTGLRDGGDVYIFGATVHNLGKVLLLCKKDNV